MGGSINYCLIYINYKFFLITDSNNLLVSSINFESSQDDVQNRKECHFDSSEFWLLFPNVLKYVSVSPLKIKITLFPSSVVGYVNKLRILCHFPYRFLNAF